MRYFHQTLDTVRRWSQSQSALTTTVCVVPLSDCLRVDRGWPRVSCGHSSVYMPASSFFTVVGTLALPSMES